MKNSSSLFAVSVVAASLSASYAWAEIPTGKLRNRICLQKPYGQ